SSTHPDTHTRVEHGSPEDRSIHPVPQRKRAKEDGEISTASGDLSKLESRSSGKNLSLFAKRFTQISIHDISFPCKSLTKRGKVHIFASRKGHWRCFSLLNEKSTYLVSLFL